MKCKRSFILLSGCLLSASLYAADDKMPALDSKAASPNAYTIDLYVDTKTKQIYSEPEEGRVRMGSFEKVADKPAKPASNESRGEAVAAGKDNNKGEMLLRDVTTPDKTAGGFGFANWKEKDPFKWNLNPDGSQYIKFGFLNQVQ